MGSTKADVLKFCPVAATGVSGVTGAAVERKVIVVDLGHGPRAVGSGITFNSDDRNFVWESTPGYSLAFGLRQEEGQRDAEWWFQ